MRKFRKASNLRIVGAGFILLFVFSICAVQSFAQAVASLESDELLMGKTMRLSISVPVPNDSAKVQFPLIDEAQMRRSRYASLANDSVEILTKYTKSFASEGDKKWVRYNLALQAFDSGRFELPPFDFVVDGKPVKSNGLTLSVLPVKATADDPIEPFSDIAEPFELNPYPEELENPSSLLWWLIPISVIMLALIIYLYFRFRKTGKLLILGKPQPPYLIALGKLRKLQTQNLPQKGKTKEYYTRLSDILRSYINRQFGIKTFEKTSSEILAQVKENDHLSQYEEVLRSIFETSDFVKFAKVKPSVVENNRCLTDAERFVEISHPVTEEKKGGEK